MLVDTRSNPLTRFLSTNSTAAGTSITQPAAQKAKPTCDQTTGIIDLANTGFTTPNGLLVLPYGTDTAAQTFLMEFYAWDRVNPRATQISDQWMTWLLAAFTCTLGTYVCGVPGSEVDGNQLAAGTIVQTIGGANVSAEVINPAGNKQASIILDTKGARLVQAKFAINAASVSCNAVWKPL